MDNIQKAINLQIRLIEGGKETMNIFNDEELSVGLLEHSGYGIVVTDTQGKVEWVNDLFVSMCGYSIDEIIGKKPGALLQGPLTDSAVVKRMRKAIQEKNSCSVEILNYHKDGDAYWVAIDLIPLRDKAGKFKNFVALEKEITSRKIAELEKEKTIVELYSALLHHANFEDEVSVK
ncbi:MAG: PAS domain S-box protein [Verrucomicrobiota bacterium]|nr:PAS domain S-box protein [Verrucomicrobiota bacterium]